MTWMILCLGGTVAVGFFGIAYFSAHPEVAGPVTENPERVFIELAKLLFNPWVAGVLLSAILAAVMSTLSCQLLVCSSALTEDFYKAFLRKHASQRELVWVGRVFKPRVDHIEYGFFGRLLAFNDHQVLLAGSLFPVNCPQLVSFVKVPQLGYVTLTPARFESIWRAPPATPSHRSLRSGKELRVARAGPAYPPAPGGTRATRSRLRSPLAMYWTSAATWVA